jgi:nucleoside-diphosphate-sugar epimerase
MIPYNMQDAQTLIDTFEDIAQRVVAISSGDVYRAYGRVIGIELGPADPVPLTEDAPLRERLYPYKDRRPAGQEYEWMATYDKILVERTVMNHPRLPGTILRLPMVYGPGDPQHRLFEYLKRMDDGRPAILVGEDLASWLWSRGYVEHVAEAIVLAVTNPRAIGRIYNVGDEPTLTIAEWIQEIGNAAGWHGSIVPVPSERLPESLRTHINTSQHLVFDTTRIRRELGYQEHFRLYEMLKHTITWQRANPPSYIDPELFDYAAEDAILKAEPGH